MKEKIIQIVIDKGTLIGLSNMGKVYERQDVSGYSGRTVWGWIEIMSEVRKLKHEDN